MGLLIPCVYLLTLLFIPLCIPSALFRELEYWSINHFDSSICPGLDVMRNVMAQSTIVYVVFFFSSDILELIYLKKRKDSQQCFSFNNGTAVL